jgi:hypothetical protein
MEQVSLIDEDSKDFWAQRKKGFVVREEDFWADKEERPRVSG